MWFIYALLTFLLWGIADLFYKKGSDSRDKYSHLRIVICVGFVMGLHAFFNMIYLYIKDGWTFDIASLYKYLPASALYILSMVLGYVGLRYLQLSISSPVQNTSGAVAAILSLIIFREFPPALQAVGIVIVTIGVFALGVVEKRLADKELELAGVKVERKYRIGFYALIFPVLYAIIDSLGTFFDSWLLDENNPVLSEENANTAYELTFFFCAVVALIFLIVKAKQGKYQFNFSVRGEKDRVLAAAFETAGQFTYVMIIGGNAVIVAPIVGSYCIASVVLSRIFLKEKLTVPQYICVITVILGLIIVGISSGLSGEF